MLASLIASVSDEGRLLPGKVADLLHLSQEEMADLVGAHRNTVARAPDGPRVQRRLGVVIQILTAAMAMMESPDSVDTRNRAILWFKHQPLPGFGARTAAELVRDGQEKAVLFHLATLEEGGYA